MSRQRPENMMLALVQQASALSLAQKLSIVAMTVFVVVVPSLVLTYRDDGFQVVLTEVNSKADLSKIIGELKRAGIRYRVGGKEDTLAVETDRVSDAWRAIRKTHYQSAKPSEDLKSLVEGQSSLFLNPEMQRLQRIKALESEIGKTLALYDSVEFARVHLTQPPHGLYDTRDQHTTASIFLELSPGRRLTPHQVQAIVDLTSNAVEGLKPENIKICDSMGTRYQDGDYTPEDTEATTNRQLELVQVVETFLTAKVNSSLSRLFGPDGFTTTLTVSLGATGRAGRGFRPPVSAASLEVTTSYRTAVLGPETIMGVSTTRLVSTTAMPGDPPAEEPDPGIPGDVLSELGHDSVRVCRLSLSVLVNSMNLPGRRLETTIRTCLEHHLKLAIGFCPRRGDSLVLMAVPFLTPPPPLPGPGQPSRLDLLGRITQNFYTFWALQIGILLTFLVLLVRNSSQLKASREHQHEFMPLSAFKQKDLRSAELDGLASMISRLTDRELRQAVMPLDPLVLATSVRLLQDSDRARILRSLDRDLARDVNDRLTNVSTPPLRQVEDCLRVLIRRLKEVA